MDQVAEPKGTNMTDSAVFVPAPSAQYVPWNEPFPSSARLVGWMIKPSGITYALVQPTGSAALFKADRLVTFPTPGQAQSHAMSERRAAAAA